MSKEIILSLVLLSTSTSPLMAKEAMEYLQDLQFELMQYEKQEASIPKETMSKYDIHKIDSIFIKENCDQKCLKSYQDIKNQLRKKESSEDYVNFPSFDDLYYQVVYKDKERTKPLGYVLRTTPLSFLIKNQVYTTKDWDKDYLAYYERVYGDLEGNSAMPMGPAIIAQENWTAIWIPELKIFAYAKENNIFGPIGTTSWNSKLITEFECNNEFFVSDQASLLSPNGKRVQMKELKGQIPIAYTVEKDFLNIYMLNTDQPVKNNAIDGRTYDPLFLMSWYGYDQYPIYKIKKNNVIGEDGKLTIFPLKVPNDWLFIANCYTPDKETQKYLQLLKAGKMTFIELPSRYKTQRQYYNIFYSSYEGEYPRNEEGMPSDGWPIPYEYIGH